MRKDSQGRWRHESERVIGGDAALPFELPEVNPRFVGDARSKFAYTNVLSGAHGNAGFIDGIQRIELVENCFRATDQTHHDGSTTSSSISSSTSSASNVDGSSSNKDSGSWARAVPRPERGPWPVASFGAGRYAGAPIFVPRPSGVAEDDGYLLTNVYDSNTHRTDIAILDAAKIDNGPLALLRLPVHVPYSFHGIWVENSEQVP